MRYQTYGFAISLMVHATAVFLLLTFCRFVPLQKKIMLVDFSTFSMEKNVVKPAEPVPAPRQIAKPRPKKAMVKDTPPITASKSEQKKIEPIIPEPDVAAAEPDPVLEPTTPAVADSAEIMPVESVPAGPGAFEEAPSQAFVPRPTPEVEYVQAHFSYIKDLIQKKLRYPGMARKMGWEGKVIVSFIVCADGQVVEIKIVESSGHAVLDKDAVKTIRAASPLPRPPVRAELVIPITYRLG